MLERELKTEVEKKPSTVEKLISLSREAFLEFDKISESKGEYKPIFQKGVNVRILEGNVKVCSIERDGKSYTIFGVEKDQQEGINFESLRPKIATEMKAESQLFSQVIGDSAKFCEEGTEFANKQFYRFSNIIENNVIVYGGTGKHDGKKADANGLVNKWADEHPEQCHRILANIVDKHTPIAINEWKNSISENIRNFYLVYSKTKEPSTLFGADTLSSDGLTNATSLCCEGGVQSLRQASVLLNKGVPVIGVTGLRDYSDPKRAYEEGTGLPWMSTASFLSFMKKKIATLSKLTSDVLKKNVDEYFSKYALYNSKAGDSCTKKGLLDKFYNQFYSDEVWKKLRAFQVFAGPEPVECINKDTLKKKPIMNLYRNSFFTAIGATAAYVAGNLLRSNRPRVK